MQDEKFKVCCGKKAISYHALVLDYLYKLLQICNISQTFIVILLVFDLESETLKIISYMYMYIS